MFYTAVSSVVTQTIMVAESEDLYNWYRVKEIAPLHVPTEWGTWDNNKWSDNRDPGVLIDEELGRIFVYYTTHADNVGYVMGIKSCPIDDLTAWSDEPYQVLPQGKTTPPESPYVIKKDGLYHMFHTDYALGVTHLISTSPIGPWIKNAGLDAGKASDGAASELVYNPDLDKWYYSHIQHHPYSSLHFAVFRELLFLDDGSVILKEIGKEFDVKMGYPGINEGIFTYSEDTVGAGGARAVWICFNDILRNPTGLISNPYELFIQDDYENLIELNGVKISEINEHTPEGESDYIQINYNRAQLRLEIIILKNDVTDALNFTADKNCTITLKAGMNYAIGKTLEQDRVFEYSAQSKQWS